MQVIINVGALQQYALEQVVAEVNAARPLDEEGRPIGAAVTADEYLQARVADLLIDYARRHCRISIADGMARLTPAEFARLKAARAVSQVVDDVIRPIFTSRAVEIAGPLWQQGIAQLAAANLLDTPAADRVAALLAPPQPGETLVPL